MSNRMYRISKIRPVLLVSAAAAGFSALVSAGCKRPAAPTSPPPSVSSPSVVQQTSTEIAPASVQYTQFTEVPARRAPSMPLPAPELLPRTVWPTVALADGRVFIGARVSAEDGGTVTLIHTGGIAKVDKRLLPKEMADIHRYDPAAAQIEAEQAATRRQATAEAIRIVETTRVAPVRRPRPTQVTSVQTIQTTTPSTDEIERAVRTRARRYFETEKRIGSGQTLSFNVMSDISEPREVSGWANRWEVTGTAGYKVYDSVHWGSFSKRSTKFLAIVEAPPGKRITVVSFEER